MRYLRRRKIINILVCRDSANVGVDQVPIPVMQKMENLYSAVMELAKRTLFMSIDSAVKVRDNRTT